VVVVVVVVVVATVVVAVVESWVFGFDPMYVQDNWNGDYQPAL